MRMACEIGSRAPPAAPWTMRARISIPMLLAMPQTAEDKLKSIVQVIRNRLRPKKLLSQPVIGSTMALATR